MFRLLSTVQRELCVLTSEADCSSCIMKIGPTIHRKPSSFLNPSPMVRRDGLGPKFIALMTLEPTFGQKGFLDSNVFALMTLDPTPSADIFKIPT